MFIKKKLNSIIFSRHFSTYRKLLETQWLSYEEIRNLQNLKLQKLVHFLSSNNSYYSSIGISKIKNIDDLKSLPFLTKDIIKKNYGKIISKNITAKRFKMNSTSGSTGEVMYFGVDTLLRNDGLGLRSDSWTGWEPGDPNLYLWGAERDVRLSWKSKLKNSTFFYNKTILSSYFMKDDDIKEYISIINRKKPKLIVGYPSSLELMAKFIIRYNNSITFPNAIITSGETLYENQRQIIENAFQAKVFNRYAAREVDVIAAECEEKEGLHISAEHLIVEIVDENGNICKPGQLGEIVITDLDNYVFPFIRYKIGDLGSYSNKHCKCGRGLPLLEDVLGRTFDLIIGTNGNRVPGNYFTLLRNKVKGIDKFQVIQKTIGEIEFLLESNTDFTEIEEKYLKELLKDKLGEDTNIKLKKVNQIKPTKSGKHRWIISNVSPFVTE